MADPAESANELLLAVSHLVLDRLRTGERGQVASAALNLLLHQPRLPIKDLATQLGVSHSATVRLVDRLCLDGLTRREPGRGRVIHVELTTAGRRSAQAEAAHAHRVTDDALKGLAPAARKRLTQLLVGIAASLARDQSEIDRACRRCDQQSCAVRGCPLDPPPARLA
jgi:DNA-binding MarR family transcriptional regulator